MGYCVRTKIGILYVVLNTACETIFPIIYASKTPGKTIITDGAAIYQTLCDFCHNNLTVIHDRNFADPVTGVTTNHVESM